MLSLGLNCYSCDINDEFAQNCREKYPSSVIYTGESVKFFEEYLPKIDTKSYVWLDGHHPNNYQRPRLFTMDNYFPALKELELIKQLKPNYQYDIIAVDDLNTIEAEDNPMCNPKEVPPQILTAKGHLLQEYKEFFKDTHDVSILSNGCGIMLCLPKNKI